LLLFSATRVGIGVQISDDLGRAPLKTKMGLGGARDGFASH
jgi:hypothetical protein